MEQAADGLLRVVEGQPDATRYTMGDQDLTRYPADAAIRPSYYELHLRALLARCGNAGIPPLRGFAIKTFNSISS
jgi:hypothetical protein